MKLKDFKKAINMQGATMSWGYSSQDFEMKRKAELLALKFMEKMLEEPSEYVLRKISDSTRCEYIPTYVMRAYVESTIKEIEESK